MIHLVNYESGQIEISDGEGRTLRLNQEAANRLVMTARMHTVSEFIEKLPVLISEGTLLSQIQVLFEGKSSSEKWNLKEKFARLQTVSKGYHVKNPESILEKVLF